jgi:site-specific recombinase XerD
MTALRQRMLEDLRIRNYAPGTVRCYIRAVAEFAQHFNKPPDQLGAEEIRRYQLFLLNEKRVKLSSYIQAICALRFFYQNTLHRRIDIDRIPLPRYEKKLPIILSKAEVKALLEAPQNVKHRAMLATMYGAGLRVSEVASLKVSDLPSEDLVANSPAYRQTARILAPEPTVIGGRPLTPLHAGQVGGSDRFWAACKKVSSAFEWHRGMKERSVFAPIPATQSRLV